jgi:hypothetical protein
MYESFFFSHISVLSALTLNYQCFTIIKVINLDHLFCPDPFFLTLCSFFRPKKEIIVDYTNCKSGYPFSCK